MFLLLNLYGVELSFRVSVIVTLGALAILAIYWVSALPSIDFNHWALNIGVGADGKAVELPEGGGSWFPFGWKGVLATLPFAVWLFLAIEQLPLAAEESADPKKDMPKGLILGMADADGLRAADHLPELQRRRCQTRCTARSRWRLRVSRCSTASACCTASAAAKTLAFLAVIGLIASFHTIIYAYGRQIYSLARAGYYLPFMSLTNAQEGAAHGAVCRHAAGLRHHADRVVRRAGRTSAAR